MNSSASSRSIVSITIVMVASVALATAWIASLNDPGGNSDQGAVRLTVSLARVSAEKRQRTATSTSSSPRCKRFTPISGVGNLMPTSLSAAIRRLFSRAVFPPTQYVWE